MNDIQDFLKKKDIKCNLNGDKKTLYLEPVEKVDDAFSSTLLKYLKFQFYSQDTCNALQIQEGNKQYYAVDISRPTLAVLQRKENQFRKILFTFIILFILNEAIYFVLKGILP